MLADLSASLGYVWGGLVPLLLLLCVGQKVEHYDTVWRTSFALGLVPPLVIFWFRLRMAVSTAYRRSAMRKQRTPYLLAFRRYWRPFLGGAATWFLYNWISIPFGIFSSTIISRTGAENSLVKNLGWGVVINCFYIPVSCSSDGCHQSLHEIEHMGFHTMFSSQHVRKTNMQFS